jgi:branched-chain amino acid transport system substrate-binding protein
MRNIDTIRKILVIFFMTVLLFSSCKKDEPIKDNFTTIKVAGLFSKTGDLSYLGNSSEAAINIAIVQINNDFQERQIPYRFALTVFDTKIDPVLAVSAMRTLAADGYKLVIGPQTSAELLAIKPIADSLGILVVSPSSTASSLSIPDDMVFRYAPGEQITGRAMANTLKKQGKKALIAISRNDAGSLGLNTAITSNFVGLGGSTVSAGNFAGTDLDFSVVLAEVKKQILQYAATYSKSEIAVLSTSFDETTLLFHQAAKDSVLSSVNWLGGVGFFKNKNLLKDTLASQFAVTTQFFSPGFTLPASNQSVWAPLLSQIFNSTNIQGDALTLSAYDVMKVFGSMIETGKGLPNTPTALRSSFAAASNAHIGTTGIIMLNANGDRANGVFDYYGLKKTAGIFDWYFVGQSE